jgi:hypothetical protein
MNEDEGENRIAKAQAWFRQMHSQEWSPFEFYKPKKVRIENDMDVKTLARLLELKDSHIINELFSRGVIRTVDQMVERIIAQKLAGELGFILTDADDDDSGSARVRKPIRPDDSGGTALRPT